MTFTETTTAPRYSDARLLADLSSGAPGLERQAALLLDVPFGHRAAYAAEMRFRMNCLHGGRPSDHLAAAIRGGIDGLTSPMALALVR